MRISTNIVSSLEKCRPDLAPCDYARLKEISALGGERINFQFVVRLEEEKSFGGDFSIEAESELDGLRLRSVKNVYTEFDTFIDDESRESGKFLDYPNRIYPDILEDMPKNNIVRFHGTLMAFWADIKVPKGTAAGEYSVKFSVKQDGETVASDSIKLEVIGTSLAEPDYICTNWFHVDCLADYYSVPLYSEEHWRIIESFMASAFENGINTILVPVLTPPLDTAIGHYRKTSQLVKISLDNGKYSFDFSLLDRYIALCKKIGFKYYEISHLFSQWGAKYAPKVVADITENGITTEKRIFGWDTPGTEGKYPEFLRCFIPALKEHFSSLGILENCVFHISDEPTLETLEGYRAAKNIVGELLRGLKTIDACSHTEFFEDGLMETPVPSDTNISPFLALDIPERWTYYCMSKEGEAPNRAICYPSYRNRILGTLMYKYNITGFLHWAFDFYYDRGSLNLVNPYTDMSGGGWVNAGDPFVVYPASGGVPCESLRLMVFGEVFSDLRALKKCEELCGRDAVISLIDSEQEIDFTHYPANNEYILSLRERVNELIKNAL